MGDFSLPPSDAEYPAGIYTPPAGRSGTLFFKTLPAPGKVTRKDKSLLRIGVVADIGQNPDAERSVLRLSQSNME